MKRRAVPVLVLAGLVGCGRGQLPRVTLPGLAEGTGEEPVVEVLLWEGLREVLLGADGRIEVSGPGLSRRVMDGRGPWTLAPAEQGLTVTGGRERAAPLPAKIWFQPTEAKNLLEIQGFHYRGRIGMEVVGGKIQVANRLSVEEYLRGVVVPELGRRGREEVEAVKAQAVAARTYALKHLLVEGPDGRPLRSGTIHQAYWGVRGEDRVADEGIRQTRGEILVYKGTVIEAVYHGSCGGRTADAGEAWGGGAFPYLVSRWDREGGRFYDLGAPQFEWEVNWTGSELEAILKGTLGTEFGQLEDLRVPERGPSSRVIRLVVVGSRSKVEIRGDRIRSVLRPSPGRVLNSTYFDLKVSRKGGRVVAAKARGRGQGHGVGLCQWGSIGRARSGHDYRGILSHYYPGTQLVRLEY